MRTVTMDSAIAEQQSFEELPERVREALGELAGAARRASWPSRSVSGSASFTS